MCKRIITSGLGSYKDKRKLTLSDMPIRQYAYRFNNINGSLYAVIISDDNLFGGK